ncbi:MAG: 6,7-dimethyl-8-ribityllumazine synthase [Actinobacteria bacterium]|nr:6,7-dimethyl-8-ribityllumazine synthase [Actinomycetota bacterium]
MSGQGSPDLIIPNANGAKVVIVAASWHETIMSGLIDGAVRTLNAAQADATVVRVPGTFELSLAAQAAIAGGADAVVALGVVIKGDTPHFDYVCRAVTDGLNRVSLDTGVPIGFGVLTCDNTVQALARAGLADSEEDKGAEAAQAALQMLQVIATLKNI